MASSNVEFYQKQKELQDSMLENEEKRKKLEAQLQAYCRSDQKLAKLRAVRLQSYWKRICDDEKASKQRNQQLLRDLDRMEANMASLEARREKLKHMKDQYFSYIERTYPQWMELMQKKKQEYMLEQQQRYQQSQQQQMQQNIQQQQYIQQLQQQQQQQDMLYQQQQQQQQQQMLYQQQQQQQQQQQSQTVQPQVAVTPQVQSVTQSPSLSRPAQSSGTQPKPKPLVIEQQGAFLTQQFADSPRNIYQEEDGDIQFQEITPYPTTPSPPPPPAAFTGDTDREYTNLKNVHRDTHTSAPPSSQPIPSVTVHMPSVQGESTSPAKGSRPDSGHTQNWLAAERDTSVHSVSFSEEVEIPISQPVQSVTVRQKSAEPAKPVVRGMEPLSDDDISDLDEEPDLPSGADKDQVGLRVKPPSPTAVVADDEDSDQSPAVVHPDVSMSGLLQLIQYVETEMSDAMGLDGYYRTNIPDEMYRKEIIQKANSAAPVSNLDGELVSMVILQQLTLVVRRLPGACMLSDTLLMRGQSGISEADIRENLHRDAQPLWDRLIEHFVLLVKNNGMDMRAVAHLFVPCLVHANSRLQETAVSVLEQVIDSSLAVLDGHHSPVHQDSTTLDTARSSQQGGVPRLKFGSLVESKTQCTDDESSLITQSITTDIGPKVPLNETDAYKSLISGSKPAQTVAHDDTDTSDNDLEKQVVSALSPRSHGSKTHPEPQKEVISRLPKDDDYDLSHDASHDMSHDQEPQSEISSPLVSPVYVPTGVEKHSTIKSLGSTGGSSQQRKLAGMIGSDLDTDTELDLDHMVQKKDEDDDDFYDFYG